MSLCFCPRVTRCTHLTVDAHAGYIGKCEKRGVTSGSFGPALEFQVRILAESVTIGESLVRDIQKGLLVPS